MRLRNGQAAGETSGPRKPTSLRQDPLISTLPGRFTILEELGRGGMGVVYRAKHELTGGEVAIKVLSSTLASDSDSVRRFIREARAGTLIDNDNIVRVLDMDVTTEDRLFLVMEYLKGKTLQELIGGNQLTWERAKPIILQVCGALAAAHKQGVVHRDLKPENIFLIEKNGRGNFVKVLDFGLAKFLDLGKESGQLTAVGSI
ncbi:serine/threonine protein kinase [Candidatus Micrarchaeota archaeon]|nr:serine/threonine protein kinase [Candidatus Micrarchaeota archaeon]